MLKTDVDVRKLFFFLTTILVIFFGYELGNRHFADPDEGRYVEIPREMVVSEDYVTPRLNGLKYFEKPPLMYWLQAMTIKSVGIGEYSMRFWIAFFAVLGCLSVFVVGWKCGSTTLGLLSASILATNLLYYAHSRIIILDLAVSVLICGVLWCFFLAFVRRRGKKENDERDEHPPQSIVIAMYVLAALACLTKGLIGVILPGFVGFLWIALTNNWKKIPKIISLSGILVFLAIFLPWHIAVCLKNPDFFHFYFVVEHFLRYTTQIHGRYQPVWFFLPVIIGGLLPWTGFALVALGDSVKKAVKSRNPENIFFLCWIFGIFVFYSFSNSKLIPYILPIVPPIAFVTAQMLVKIDIAEKKFRIGTIINVVLFFCALVAFFFARDQISDVISTFPEVNTLMVTFSVVIIISMILLVHSIFSKKQIDNTILLYIFLAMNMLWIINKAAPFYQDVKKPSTKHLAKIVAMNKMPDDQVFCFGRYWQDFPVYMRSVVGVVDYIGELEFGNNAEKNDRLITSEQLLEQWDGERRLFVLLTREDYRKLFSSKQMTHTILDFDRNFVVITNR